MMKISELRNTLMSSWRKSWIMAAIWGALDDCSTKFSLFSSSCTFSAALVSTDSNSAKLHSRTPESALCARNWKLKANTSVGCKRHSLENGWQTLPVTVELASQLILIKQKIRLYRMFLASLSSRLWFHGPHLYRFGSFSSSSTSTSFPAASNFFSPTAQHQASDRHS